MEKRLTRNYSDPESRKWWEEAEKAAANAPRIIIPSSAADLKMEAQAQTTPSISEPQTNQDSILRLPLD